MTSCRVGGTSDPGRTSDETISGSAYLPLIGTTRLTRTPGESAITFEPSTGRIDVITHDFDGGGPLTYRTSSDGTDWTAAPISDTRELTDPVIRVDPATNRLVVLAISWSDEMPGIVLLTLS